MNNTDFVQKIRDITQECIEKDEVFLVEVVVKGHPNSRKVSVLVDADGGINIDDCSSISRLLSARLDEEDFLDGKYTLEVSSPGVDHPLLLERQYYNHIGRSLKVITKAGETLTGKLLEVTPQNISLELKKDKKGKNKTEPEDKTISFEEIEKTFVLVTF